MTDLLTAKNAIIYGGDLGGGVARTLAREGANVFLAGRPPELQQIADTAAFLASDGAGAITSGIVNATCGLVAG